MADACSGSHGDSAPALHHLALRAGDVEKTSRFYVEMLELSVVRDDRPRAVWLALGGGAVLMIEARADGETAVPEGSLELFALRVSGPRKATIRAHALANGSFDGETEHTVYLRDPDGRRTAVSTFPLGAAFGGNSGIS